MNYRTELMDQILTNPKAQEMIDYVSPIYGESYVGLWIFQAIGTVLGGVYDISAQLRYETSPATATILLPYWEQEYNLAADSSLTTAQRRARIISAMRSRGACTPDKLASAVSSALGGVPVEVIEKPGTNSFIVNIRQVVNSVAPAVAIIDRMKPAHLSYTIQGVTEESASTDIKAAAAITHGLQYAITPRAIV